MNVVVFLTLMVATLGISAAYGGAPERWTACMFACAALASHLLYNAGPRRYVSVETDVAVIDLLLLAGITAMMIKADRFWPMAMFAAHGVTVLSHVVKTFDPGIVRRAYAISIAAPAYLTLAILLAAVFRHRRRLRCHGTDRDWSRTKEL